MQSRTIKIHPNDNVQVALAVLYKGEEISDEKFSRITLQQNIPAKHKFVLDDMQEGDAITMYGVLVGKAIQPIPKGGLITTQNVKHAANSYRLREHQRQWHAPDVSNWQEKMFMGFHRTDGSVGTRKSLGSYPNGILRK
jgi:altronate hydrolase